MTGGPGGAGWGATAAGGRRRPGALRWLLVVLLATPVLELVVLVWVAHRLGAWTVLLLLASAVLGVLILRRGGPSTLRRVREATRAGRPPTRELADAFLTVLGGVLLVVPGFVTDVVGLACLVPPFRWGARALLLRVLSRAVSRGTVSFRTAGRPVVRGSVVDGGLVDDGVVRDGASKDGRHPDSPPVIEGRVLPDAHDRADAGDHRSNGTGQAYGNDSKDSNDGKEERGPDDDDRPRRGG